MNASWILESLVCIRDRYRAVAAVSETMFHRDKAQELIDAVNQRRRLLAEIEERRHRLPAECRKWSAYARDGGPVGSTMEEIRTLVHRIVTMDVSLQKKLQARIAQTRDEIQGLTRRSHAALSYARHASSTYRMR
ncbi:MAG: hypothetical protein GF344_15280 [Chitinivibrionales bacterium]|nr:hypothetical protein [Chitinivibrionales bacterium]MBD3358067.1 hypothetical protein [Chitinivibrionales bacterium]